MSFPLILRSHGFQDFLRNSCGFLYMCKCTWNLRIYSSSHKSFRTFHANNLRIWPVKNPTNWLSNTRRQSGSDSGRRLGMRELYLLPIFFFVYFRSDRRPRITSLQDSLFMMISHKTVGENMIIIPKDFILVTDYSS